MSSRKMNTVCLLGSPRRGGNSDTLAQRFVQQACAYEVSPQTFALSDLNYNGCQNLFHCKEGSEHCGQVDDLTEVLKAISTAQVLVLATPVYFTSVSGPMKLAIDRFFSFFVPNYPSARKKSRLKSARHLVFLQTQGEPENMYAGILDSFSASFTGLGFDQHHLVRACEVRQPGDIFQASNALEECDAIAALIYGDP